MILRTYSELIALPTWEERLAYVYDPQRVGEETFGAFRVFNQMFYRSKEWRDARYSVIVRDNACDLAVPGHDIYKFAQVHHLNPITLQDIQDHSDKLLNPEFLICVSPETHKILTYGRDIQQPPMLLERTPGDTCLWKK